MVHIKERKNENKRLVLSLVICVILLGMVCGGGYRYYRYRQAQIVLPEPRGYTWIAETDVKNLEEITEGWFDSLMSEYRQPFMQGRDRIRDPAIQSLEVLGEVMSDEISLGQELESKNSALTVQLDFSFIASDKSEIFPSWGCGYSDQQWQCQWVIIFDQQKITNDQGEQKASYIANYVERPAAYDLMMYQLSGQKEIDEYQHQMEMMATQSGEVDWTQYKIVGLPAGVTRARESFYDQENGYLAIGYDKTMSWERTMLYKTNDGGENWEVVGDVPNDHPASGLVFFDQNLGFMSFSNNSGMIEIMRTKNGGKSWQEVVVEVSEELIPYFTRAEVPFLEDEGTEEKMVLLIGEDASSDFAGQQNHYLRYISVDEGATWEFIEIIEKEIYLPG